MNHSDSLSTQFFEDDLLIKPSHFLPTLYLSPEILSPSTQHTLPALSGLFTQASSTDQELQHSLWSFLQSALQLQRAAMEGAGANVGWWGVGRVNANVTNMKIDYYSIQRSTLGICTSLKIAWIQELLVWTAVVLGFEQRFCFIAH